MPAQNSLNATWCYMLCYIDEQLLWCIGECAMDRAVSWAQYGANEDRNSVAMALLYAAAEEGTLLQY